MARLRSELEDRSIGDWNRHQHPRDERPAAMASRESRAALAGSSTARPRLESHASTIAFDTTLPWRSVLTNGPDLEQSGAMLRAANPDEVSA